MVYSTKCVITVFYFVFQPAPRDNPIQCFIKRERATSTYSLYLGLSPGKIVVLT